MSSSRLLLFSIAQHIPNPLSTEMPEAPGNSPFFTTRAAIYRTLRQKSLRLYSEVPLKTVKIPPLPQDSCSNTPITLCFLWGVARNSIANRAIRSPSFLMNTLGMSSRRLLQAIPGKSFWGSQISCFGATHLRGWRRPYLICWARARCCSGDLNYWS